MISEFFISDYLPPGLEPILKANGVEKTVLVQASNSIEESNWLLELSDQYPFIAGVVGWVDLMSSTVDDQIKQLARHPQFKGRAASGRERTRRRLACATGSSFWTESTCCSWTVVRLC